MVGSGSIRSADARGRGGVLIVRSHYARTARSLPEAVAHNRKTVTTSDTIAWRLNVQSFSGFQVSLKKEQEGTSGCQRTEESFLSCIVNGFVLNGRCGSGCFAIDSEKNQGVLSASFTGRSLCFA
jgi:hypothetical protein